MAEHLVKPPSDGYAWDTEFVRSQVAHRPTSSVGFRLDETDVARFDYWLATHDAEVRASALRAAAADFAAAAHKGIEPALNYLAAKLLSSRADKIEKEIRRG